MWIVADPPWHKDAVGGRSHHQSRSKPSHTLVYKARSYTADDGATKTVYATIGAAWLDDAGQIATLRLDTIPVTWDGTLYLRAREEAAQ